MQTCATRRRNPTFGIRPQPRMSSGSGKIAFAVAGYATCSSLMLIVNKVCVHLLPAPSFVLLMQVAAAAIAVKGCGLLGLIEVDELEVDKLKALFF